ncbi:MAG: DUF3769 domain-containing protein [Dolichospermum sp.]|nr:DUF3769 domain-containing protein [Dolichospermum sp.]
MFHPLLPPQLPPNLESSKPAYHLAATPVVKVETNGQKPLIDGKDQDKQHQSISGLVNEDVVNQNFSPLSSPEQLSPEFSSANPQVKGEVNNTTVNQQLLAEISTPPKTEQSPVNLQESGGKFDLSVGENTPAASPIQNIIEFKLRNSPKELPTTVEFPLSPQLPEPEKIPAGKGRVVEVIANSQEYDEQRRIVTAKGNVVVRFDGAVIDADSLQINLDNLIAVGEGNVALTRGNQVLQGQRFTYNFIQDSGDLENGKGELYIPTTDTDFAFSSTLPTDITAGGVPSRPLSNRIRANQPVTSVNSPGGIEFGVSGQSDARNVASPKFGGVVKRLRFEAQRIEFYPRGFQAQDARITNDPFSPPELEIRADKVTVTREAPLIDRITTQRQRLVFDQKVVIPIPINSRKIDRRPRQVNPTIVSVGFDNDKRGGLFVERSFEPINNDQTRWIVTPQFYLQRALKSSENVASLFGVNTKVNAVLSPKTVLEGTGELTSFDFDQLENNLRGSLRLRQALGNVNPYTLSLESSYRDRLYNGSLGYQTVQSSIGGIITSPIIPLGKSGVNLSYQGGAQYIDANTDRQDLLSPVRKNDRISLSRLQGSVALSGGINLWQGKPLAATATEGLKYTPNSVVPYLQAIAGVTGTTSYYSSGDNQSTLIGTIGLVGQIGNFSRPYLDYTAFNVSYSQGTNSGLSPFLFDRSVDNKVLNAGISQQVYGPFRLGLQTSVNLDTGKETSTDYIMEYSRRTYGITFRYNPVLELGGFSLRISDFNWTGGTDPFTNGQVKPVVGGVVRQDN